MHRHKRASLAWKLPVKCQIQPLARIKLPPLTFFFLFTFYVFYFSFLSFPSSVSLPSAVFSVSTLLMLVEGLRANAVNVSGFKALQMSACFIYLSISLFFFQKSAKNRARDKSVRFGDRFHNGCNHFPSHPKKKNYSALTWCKQVSKQFLSNINLQRRLIKKMSSSIAWPMSTDGVFKEALVFLPANRIAAGEWLLN